MKTKKKLRSICRICLEASQKKCMSLFENYKNCMIADHITSITNISIKKDDGLPRKICPSCLLELAGAIDFKEKCQRSSFILDTSNAYKLGELPAIERSNSELKEIFVKKEEQQEEIVIIETSNDAEYLGLLDFVNTDEQKAEDVLTDAVVRKSKSIDQKLECHDCGNLFKSKCKLRVHWKKVHLPESLICVECKRIFRSYKAYNKHKKEKGLACVIAGSDQVRIEGEGKSRVFYCKECNYKSIRIKDIQSHLVIHSGDRPYQCDMCPSTYTQLCSLQGHKEIAHNEYRVQITCHFCGKIVKGRRRVYRHLKIHTENQVQCKVCKKTLKNKKYLELHMKRHSGVKNYTCERCAVSFYTTAELCNHRRTVHNKGKHWFHCDQCEYKSVRAEAIRKHRPKHTEGNISCTICGRFVESNQKLLLHQRRHFEDKKFACTYCDVKFFRKDSVRTHIKKKHKHLIVVSQQEPVDIIAPGKPAVQSIVTVKQEQPVVVSNCLNVIEIKFSPPVL